MGSATDVRPESRGHLFGDVASERYTTQQLRKLLKSYAARAGLVLSSLALILACDVVTGLRALDDKPWAPWARSAVLIGVIAGIAVIARCASVLLSRVADEREVLGDTLLRRELFGPSRRWSMWLATAATACLTAYLLNEHQPAVPSLSGLWPAKSFDGAPALIGLGVVGPYIADLTRGVKVRRWPFSKAPASHREVNEEPDVVGYISRLVPPLLIAFFLTLIMCVTTLAVAAHAPAKLLGGFGVISLFLAALLTAPALLRVHAQSFEPIWLSRWYSVQLRLTRRLRRVVAAIRSIAAVAQVTLFGLALGLVMSGSKRATTESGSLVIAAIEITLTGAVLARVLWAWAPQLGNSEPIRTDTLMLYERQLLRVAGVLLVLGTVCSLAAILSS
jgi:hypothetical protein